VEGAFGVELERWLRSGEAQTFGDMGDAFAEKGFAVTALLLMSLPALPLPTGGITHVFEAVTVLVGAEMVLGRRTLWLPRRLRRRPLGPLLTDRALPAIIRMVRWFERHSRRRLPGLFAHRFATRALGLVIIGFALAAALAPPFSGLDTVPALGVVGVAMAIVLEDALVLALGLLVGVGGVALIVSLGAAVVHLVERLV
jgi:hypothetical protein